MDLSKDYGFIEKNSQQGLESILHSILDKFSVKNAEIFFHQRDHVKQINKQTINHSICYKKKEIGVLQIPQNSDFNYHASTKFPEICREVNLLVNRYITNEDSHSTLERCEEFIGSSKHILDIENFIEKAANSHYPVIIKGQSGCEKLAVASAIHCYSNKSNMPFRELNCVTVSDSKFEKELYHLMNIIDKGTIYLSDIDKLTLKQQYTLVDFLSAKSSHKNFKRSHHIRFIVSSSTDLSLKVSNDSYSEKIVESFSFLNIEIPCLKDRNEDIPYLIDYFFLKNSNGNKKSFTEDAIEALKNYIWPGNYHELEKTMIKLITLSENRIIEIEDIKKHAPYTLQINQDKPLKNDSLIKDLLDKNSDNFKYFHTGLQRSLNYIATYYHQDITLANLSENAFVSPSHLSYLFRHHLGKSFKQILSELRVEKVKELFLLDPNKKITVASLEVGFGDLSHFEKIFKRYTNMTPREYKKRLKNEYKLH